MFNSNLRDFDEDPFFSDPFRAHREHMRQMMSGFSESFGVPSIMDSGNRGRAMPENPSSSRDLRDEHRDAIRNPFGMVDNMMANMRNRMQDMHRNFENTPPDSNTHSFSSSSVMTYSKVGNEPPKVFQAASSTRRAPGGVRETRRAVKDSESGLEKMSIGHHIQDKGHVVEKKFNKKTGERELNQDFQNMDESEGQSFDEEWQQVLTRAPASGPRARLEEGRPRPARRAAVAGPEQPHRNQSTAKVEGKSSLKVKGSSKQ